MKSRRTILYDFKDYEYENDKELKAWNSQGVHAGLWLDRYLPEQERKSTETREQQGQKTGGGRAKHISDVCQLAVPEAYNGFFTEWRKQLEEGYGAKSREAEAIGRISIGLGAESVLETSVSLHHTYGVPFIPGSALKGLLASYMRQKLFPQQQQEKKAEQESKGSEPQESDPWVQAHTIICGNTTQAGYIVFFDALYMPEENHRPLQPDVITVHHQKYYQGRDEAPADWDSPIPVPFPSTTGKYLIALAAPDLEPEQGDAWIQTTFAILEEALKTMGIGAKTSSGYGRMRYVQKNKAGPAISAQAQTLIEEIRALPQTSVNQQIQTFHSRWQQFSDEPDRRAIAQAIIDRVHETGYEERKKGKAWYQELLGYVDKGAS